MVSNNKPLAATTISAISAAAVVAAAAALSAYFIASSSSRQTKSKKDKDLQLLLTRFEEMKGRLDKLEKEKKENIKQQGGNGGNRSEFKGRGSYRKRHSHDGPHPRQLQQQTNKSNNQNHSEVDSNANVLPPPHSDEDDSLANYRSNPHNRKQSSSLPQTIVTKPHGVEDRASQFLHNPRREANQDGSTAQPVQLQRARSISRSGAGSTTSTSNPAHAPVPIVLISDPGQDLDDEMMFIMARHLESLDLISLKGVIANLSPSFARARLTRGTLDLLGLHRVPVGIGTDGGDVIGKHSSDQFETTASSYIIHEDGEAARGLESGHRLLQTLYDAASDIEYVDVIDEEEDDDENEKERGEFDAEEEDGMPTHNNTQKQSGSTNNKKTKKVAKGGLTIVMTSSMKDIAIFVRDNPTLFASKTREVVVMGGCKPVPAEDLAGIECEPDTAHNNTFDSSASAFFYSQCQKMNITLTVVSRYAAYAAKMPRSVYDDLALTGSSIGWRLRNSQRASIDQLWQRACSTELSVRKGLPPRCDRKWFISTFCGGDDDPSRCCADTAWDLVTGFMQYDTIALLAAVPAVRDSYFDPFVMPPLLRAIPTLGKDPGNKLLADAVGEEQPTAAAAAGSDVVAAPEENHTGAHHPMRRRSTIADETDAAAVANGIDETAAKKASRRISLPGPRAIQRAIARAAVDNEYVETPFEQHPGIPAPFDRGTRNLIGISDKEHNLKDPSLLVDLLKTGYRQGILCNHHTQPHIILHLQLRWDNLADTLLTCLMLRSLWDMRLASVLGVIVSICPSDSEQAKRPPDEVSVSSEDGVKMTTEGGGDDENKKRQPSDMTTESTDDDDDEKEGKQSTKEGGDKSKTNPAECPSTLGALAESIRATLSSIGLSHVKFLIVSGGNSMTEHKRQSTEAFRELYESAPPIGVTLVLTATFTSVWPFAESHPELFRNKTVRVVHTGGALIWPARWGWAALPFSHGHNGDNDDSNSATSKEDEDLQVTSEQILVPDPAAQNHRLDMSSARLFYKRAQALSVPMVILSRHVAKECCIPRNFFDVMGSHGGEVGKRIYKNERDSLLNLWRCSCAPSGSAARGNLPERCDADWFAENFCAGHMATSEEEVWRSVEAVNLYSPIALLAALPGETVQSYFHTMPFPVRSATHHVIGLTERVPHRNVNNPSELRSLVVQSLLSAALANESEFAQEAPPMVPIRMDHEQRRRAGRGGGSGGFGAPGYRSNSVISTISFPGVMGGGDRGYGGVDEDDMWTFSEAARREIFSRTVAQTSKNAVLPKETKRKFVGIITKEGRSAATNGWVVSPQAAGEEE